MPSSALAASPCRTRCRARHRRALAPIVYRRFRSCRSISEASENSPPIQAASALTRFSPWTHRTRSGMRGSRCEQRREMGWPTAVRRDVRREVRVAQRGARRSDGLRGDARLQPDDATSASTDSALSASDLELVALAEARLEVLDGAEASQPPVDHDAHATNSLALFHGVCREDDRALGVLRRDPSDHVPHKAPGHRIHASRRFVQEDEEAADRSDTNGQLSFVAARQLAGQLS